MTIKISDIIWRRLNISLDIQARNCFIIIGLQIDSFLYESIGHLFEYVLYAGLLKPDRIIKNVYVSSDTMILPATLVLGSLGSSSITHKQTSTFSEMGCKRCISVTDPVVIASIHDSYDLATIP